MGHIEKYVPDDFFEWLDIFHKCMGLLPPKNLPLKIMYLLVSFPHIFMCTFLLVFQGCADLMVKERSFKDTMFGISVVTLHGIIVIRAGFWIWSRNKFEKIIEIIRRETFTFECFDWRKIGYSNVISVGKNIENVLEKKLSYRQIGILWRESGLVLDKCSADLEFFRKRKMFCTRLGCCSCYIVLIIFSLATVTLLFISELYVDSYQTYNPHLHKTSEYRKYLIPMYFPFDTSLDGYYRIAYFYTYYSHIGAVIIFLPIETTLTCSIIHLISQTSVVKEAFSYVDKNISDDEDSNRIVREFRIVKCINELQEIYRAIEKLEDFCNIQLMIQYGLATFLLCTICYVIPLMDNIMEGIGNSIFVSLSLGQIFIFSYCCQTLSLELQAVGISIFNLQWTDYPMKIQRSLRFSIKRLQKPAHITAGKTIIIDLLFFIQVIQKSYSFYTLITNTKNQTV